MLTLNKKISVLIIDDSKVMRKFLEKILASDPDIMVVGSAPDPYTARDLIKKLNPDVLTLDIIMPKMDGVTFLKNLMRLHPIPVVMISSLTERGSSIALEALALGAVDYLPKPSVRELEQMDDYAKKLIKTLKAAAQTKISKYKNYSLNMKSVESMIYQADFLRNKLIAIGGSTGGIEAIESILLQFPKTFPGIVITQHIRREFVTPFVRRINKLCHLMVMEAKKDTAILPGTVYIAPGSHHLSVQKRDNHYYCHLDNTAPVNGHKPSVNVLFQSVAKAAGPNAIGVLLTGMGEDGALGAKEIHDTGGTVIVQDKESSVVWGMPGSAVQLKAADFILPLQDIPAKIFQILDLMAQKKCL